ncbi:MAG: rod shape-determining protein MreC [Bacteroidales bacterium]|nr:rod shape-determining protein MreC [Clostridium sp.]MCM1204923.1 rod shape-determining protein MreC [Bacteroidales bacterium]
MNFHDKKEIPPKYIYLLLACLCFILLFFSVILENRFSPFKALTSMIITPMQSGINEVGTSLYNRVTNNKEKQALIAENKELSEKLDAYSAQIKVFEQESYELKRLQELLGLKEQYADYRTVGARVIATDSTNWFYTFVINKGTKDGVKVGCNILAEGGLAGIVTEVGSDYAKVRAIIDDNSNVSANISGTETLCTVTGDLSTIKEGYIDVGYINKSDTVEEGAELVTSHVSDKFLPGLLIGYITEVSMDANNLTKSAKCIPVVDFNNLQEVLVVLDLKADYQTDSNNKNLYDSITDTEENAASTQATTAGSEEETTSSETTTEREEEGTTAPEEGGSGEDADTGENEPEEGEPSEGGEPLEGSNPPDNPDNGE